MNKRASKKLRRIAKKIDPLGGKSVYRRLKRVYSRASHIIKALFMK